METARPRNASAVASMLASAATREEEAIAPPRPVRLDASLEAIAVMAAARLADSRVMPLAVPTAPCPVVRCRSDELPLLALRPGALRVNDARAAEHRRC